MTTPTVSLTDLGPVAQLRAGRLGRRLPQLFLGLVLYGVSMAFMVRSALGTMPWDVLHWGLARNVPFSFGQIVIGLSFLILLLWIPLREVPGLGTIANSIVIGLAADATLSLVDAPSGWLARIALLLVAIFLNGVATASYIGAQFGRGPRDGLMTGLARVTGHSIRLVRTVLEVVVVLIGLALGGVLGVGTILYALAIGPLTQLMLPWFLVELDVPGGQVPQPAVTQEAI
ncbi:MAG: hypothetical protein V9G04_04455 [Nocardioides sp.]